MRKLANNVPTASLHPNAPPMGSSSPVKAMPQPMPVGATTPPPISQMKAGSLLGATLDVGLDRLARGMTPTAYAIHAVKRGG